MKPILSIVLLFVALIASQKTGIGRWGGAFGLPLMSIDWGSYINAAIAAALPYLPEAWAWVQSRLASLRGPVVVASGFTAEDRRQADECYLILKRMDVKVDQLAPAPPDGPPTA